MPKKVMLINVTHSEESRVGIISEGILESFEIESLSREHLKGNIYKGAVRRIHPALEAAFVDIGADRDAFLPLDEICFRNLAIPPRNAQGGAGGENGRRRRIRDILRPGEEILVQIAKEQFANKPPTLTTFYSLPGRYLVLLPGSEDTGISRRIEGEDRVRLRKMIADLQPPKGFGIIVRTAAGVDEHSGELGRDFTYLQRLWESVQRTAQDKRVPALVYREHDIVLRTIRDFFTPDIDEIHIDNEEVYQRARDFLRAVMPGKEHVLRLYQGEQPIFSEFDVESQIESVFKRRVPLRSGGSIVIDGTEALTAIDVNSGGAMRGSNPEETAFRSNQEAAKEISRQLRLRDIGGLIVVDFIDMRDSGHIHDIERVMREAMRPDKARHDTGRISRLGLMEISRQRLRPAATTITYTACPMCDGHGAVRTTESAALVALRKIHNRVALGDAASLTVDLPSAVAMYLLNQKRDELAHLDSRYSTSIQINLSDRLLPHQVEIKVRPRPARRDDAQTVQPGEVAPADRPSDDQVDGGARDATARGENDTGKKRRRRRGRRRSPGLRAAVAIGEALAAIGSHATASASETAAEPAKKASGRRRGGRRRSTRARAAEAPAREAGAATAGEQPVTSEAPNDAGSGTGEHAAQVSTLAGTETEALPSIEPAQPAKRSRRRATTSRSRRSAITSKAAAAKKPNATPEATAEEDGSTPKRRTTRRRASSIAAAAATKKEPAGEPDQQAVSGTPAPAHRTRRRSAARRKKPVQPADEH